MTQLLQNCIGPTIRIGRESWCLPYAGFFFSKKSHFQKFQYSFIIKSFVFRYNLKTAINTSLKSARVENLDQYYSVFSAVFGW